MEHEYRRKELEALYCGLAIGKDFIVLDILCGNGFASRPLIGKVREIVGVDIKKQPADLGFTYIQMPIEETSFRDESFDLAIAHTGFHHVGSGNEETQLLALRKIYAALKRNGTFVISDLEGMTSASRLNDIFVEGHDTKCAWLTSSKAKRMLQGAGFRDVTSKSMLIPWEFTTYTELEEAAKASFGAIASVSLLRQYHLLRDRPAIELPLFFARGVKK